MLATPSRTAYDDEMPAAGLSCRRWHARHNPTGPRTAASSSQARGLSTPADQRSLGIRERRAGVRSAKPAECRGLAIHNQPDVLHGGEAGRTLGYYEGWEDSHSRTPHFSRGRMHYDAQRVSAMHDHLTGGALTLSDEWIEEDEEEVRRTHRHLGPPPQIRSIAEVVPTPKAPIGRRHVAPFNRDTLFGVGQYMEEDPRQIVGGKGGRIGHRTPSLSGVFEWNDEMADSVRGGAVGAVASRTMQKKGSGRRRFPHEMYGERPF